MKKTSTKTGRVYIVGAGPGRFDLLTLRAVECLKQADVVLHDRLIPQIALRRVAAEAELIYVGKKASYHTLPQDEISARLVSLARAGKTVVRLKGGDPYIFGRGGEEAEALVAAGIPFEVVPGISSALAAPLFAGIPLTHRRYTPDIAIITGHENPTKTGKIPYQHGVERAASGWVDWPAVARMGTVVILMGMGNLRANLKKLVEHGKAPNTPAAAVRWGGLAKQQSVVATVATLADECEKIRLKAPAVVVVGGVVNLSHTLNFLEKQILFGKRVVITRDPEENAQLAQKLEMLGAEVLDCPSYEYRASALSVSDARAINNAGQNDWLVFTSARAVEYFVQRYKKHHADWRGLAKVKIAAVGDATRSALLESGLWADFSPKNQSSAGLAQSPIFARTRGLKILQPLAKDARREFQEALKQRHLVRVVVVYHKKNLRLEEREKLDLMSKPCEAICFFSPSAVEVFLKNLKPQDVQNFFATARIFVIGKTTADFLKNMGFANVCVAKKPSTESVLQSIIGTFNQN